MRKPAPAPAQTKLCDASPVDQAMVIEVLKAGMTYDRLLDGFERTFIQEIVPRYAKYGFSMVVAGEQWTQFKKLAAKLNV
jgi:hypothetical protein